MALKINSIGDKGIHADERIGFTVLSSCDIKKYMVFRTRFTESGFYNISKNAYWFTPREVNAGDRVVLYTKKGNSSVKDNSDGSKTYFFYWGLDEPIFTDAVNGVVLVDINNWELSRGK